MKCLVLSFAGYLWQYSFRFAKSIALGAGIGLLIRWVGSYIRFVQTFFEWLFSPLLWLLEFFILHIPFTVVVIVDLLGLLYICL